MESLAGIFARNWMHWSSWNCVYVTSDCWCRSEIEDWSREAECESDALIRFSFASVKVFLFLPLSLFLPWLYGRLDIQMDVSCLQEIAPRLFNDGGGKEFEKRESRECHPSPTISPISFSLAVARKIENWKLDKTRHWQMSSTCH